MQKLLLQKSSGCVYPWTPDLAAMPDMVPYEPQPKAPVVEDPVPEKFVPPEPDVKSMAAIVLKRKTK